MARIDITVTTAADSGEGSLRAALARADVESPDDTVIISFDESLEGQTIFLNSPLEFSGPNTFVSGRIAADGTKLISISGDSDQDGLTGIDDSGLLVVGAGAALQLSSLNLLDGAATGASTSIGIVASAITNAGRLTLNDVTIGGTFVVGGAGVAADQPLAATVFNEEDASLDLLEVLFEGDFAAGQALNVFGGAIAGVANLGDLRMNEVGFSGQAFGGEQEVGIGGGAMVGVDTDPPGTLAAFSSVSSIRIGIGAGARADPGGGPDGAGRSTLGIREEDVPLSPLLIGQSGSSGDDVLEAQRPDVLLGFEGDDVLTSIGGPAQLFGGAGDDILTLDGGVGGEDGDGGFMDGGLGNDLMIVNRPGASVHGHADGGEGSSGGVDTISFRFVQFGGVRFDLDLARGTSLTEQEVQPGFNVFAGRIDNVEGTDFDDELLGSQLGDSGLFGGRGADTLTGNIGSDTLRGDEGDDTLSGGGGDDSLEGGAGADEVNGGGDRDLASYASSGGAVTIDLLRGIASGGHAAGDVLTDIEDLEGGRKNDRLSGDEGENAFAGGRGKDLLVGRNGADRLSGDGGADDLRGGGGADVLTGGGGRDALSGGGGSDSLIGGGAADRLDGGAANDVLTGGGGRDVFVLGRGDGRRDVITDWNRRQDTIEFESGVRRFEQLKILDRGDDVLIRYRRDAVLVEDAEVSDFRERDFDFG